MLSVVTTLHMLLNSGSQVNMLDVIVLIVDFPPFWLVESSVISNVSKHFEKKTVKLS